MPSLKQLVEELKKVGVDLIMSGCQRNSTTES